MMRCVFALLLALTPAAHGGEWQGVDGEFMAMMVLSDAPEKIYDAWYNGPPNGVKLTALPSVAPGVKLEAIVIFSGCTPDEKGNCQIEADWTVTSDTGRPIGETKDAPLWRDRPAPAARQLQISENGLGLVTTAAHGGYVFRVRVKDVVSGRSVELTQSTKVSGR
jgi:hypothetical protein